MKLSDKINTKTTISSLKSTCKTDVIHELLDHITNLNYLTSSLKLFSYLDDNKKNINTASGRGIAYHYHTFPQGFGNPHIVIGLVTLLALTMSHDQSPAQTVTQ